MAEFYGSEYTTLRVQTTPGNKVYGQGFPLLSYPFHYTQVANGTAADTIVLQVLPPKSVLDMQFSRFVFSGWTSGATLSVGWKAYKDLNGATQSLSAAGLLSVISLTVDGAWVGGMLVVATPDDSAPVVWEKDFNNSEDVVIYATIGTQAPGANDVLNGQLVCRMA